MRSFRGRLIAWNTFVVGITLVGLGGTISYVNLRNLSVGIDRDLADRVWNITNRPGGQGAPPGQSGPDGQPRQGTRGPDGPPLGPDGQGPQGPPPQNPNAGVFQDEEARTIGSIRRPRWIGRDGRLFRSPSGDTAFDTVSFQAALLGKAQYSDVLFMGEKVRVYTAPVVRDGKLDSVLQVARELRDYDRLRSQQLVSMAVFAPFALLAAAFVARILANRAIEPVKEMGLSASRIGAGDFSHRIAIVGDDEFAQLGRELNEMADKVESSFTKLTEAYEQQRRFTADASHELRTPLTRLQLATSGALNDPDADPRAALQIADESAQHMARLVKQLLELARADAGELRGTMNPVDLRVVVAEALSRLPSTGPALDVDLNEHPVMTLGDADQLERVCLNLVENARRHTSESGTIWVKVRSEGNQAVLEVRDNGVGIEEKHLSHLSERFYRVDVARSGEHGGAGLGLSIVAEIVRVHGGTLAFESEVGQGTKVTVHLPQIA